ncbi:MAG: hypothetical protein WD602_03630 [Actinomycetota bacterium]
MYDDPYQYDDPYGDRYYPAPQRFGAPQPRRKWPIALVVVLVAASASFVVFWGADEEQDFDEFCRVARRAADVNRVEVESLPQEEVQAAVRTAAARLILLHERLEQAAPPHLQGDVAEMIAGYREAVRSPSVALLSAVDQSDAGQRVGAAVVSECQQASG